MRQRTGSLPLFYGGSSSGGGGGPRQRRALRLALAAVLPFACALLVGSLWLRTGARSDEGGWGGELHRPKNRVALEDRHYPCPGGDCSGLPGARAASIAAAADGSGLPGAGGSGGASGGGTSGPPDGAAAGTQQPQPLALPQGQQLETQQGAAPAAAERPKLFLFIGILSGRGYRHRRLAVREAWASRAQVPGQVVAKFILSEDERTPQVEKELEQFGDIVFVREKTNYKSILYKTYYVMEYASTHYDASFVLKTDDDAFINVWPLMDQLRALCEFPGCRGERVYMGRMARHSEVLLQPGHKWNNAAFYNHTGLKQYPNYMMGGGYVVGGDVARTLVDVHSRMRLKFTPIEDATLGFWLSTMDLRHIDHRRFFTWAAPCCFKAPLRKPGERFITRFQLVDEFEAGLCSDDPWLVLHKIDSPTKMRYVGQRVANCTARPDPWLLPDSILEYVPPAARPYWEQQREAAYAARGIVPGAAGAAGSSAVEAAEAEAEATVLAEAAGAGKVEPASAADDSDAADTAAAGTAAGVAGTAAAGTAAAGAVASGVSLT